MGRTQESEAGAATGSGSREPRTVSETAASQRGDGEKITLQQKSRELSCGNG